MTDPFRVSDKDSPPQEPIIQTVEAMLRTERNRWFVSNVILATAMVLALMFTWHAFDSAAKNRELMYIKMYPNGSWENVTYKASDPQLYFKTTVDALLAKYVKERYSVNPAIITQDYGEARFFLSNPLMERFIAKDGFNASQKAAVARAHPSDVTLVHWQWNDHYDNYEGSLNGHSVEVQRTNIYFTTEHTQAGEVTKQPMMLTVDWTLMPKSELSKQSKTFLNINPIGLTILSQKLTKQPLGSLQQ